MTTHSENDYDAMLDDATAVLDSLYPATGSEPEGEREKAMGDALNNAWYEGLTVDDWANAALLILRPTTAETRA